MIYGRKSHNHQQCGTLRHNEDILDFKTVFLTNRDKQLSSVTIGFNFQITQVVSLTVASA